MPRKRPRNPLKRDVVDRDEAPEDFTDRKKSKFTKKKGKFAKENYNEQHDDDTPKSFKRAMSLQQRREGVVDEASEAARGRKTARKAADAYPKDRHIAHDNSSLQMKPGENWTDFSRRVDAALPDAKPRKSETAADLSKLDKKRMKKQANRVLQNQQDYKKEDEAAEEGDGMDMKRERNELFFPRKSRDKSPDPWSVLDKKKKKPKFGDVVDAPPQLTLPRKLLPNVPKSAGDAARRLILESERQMVIDEYRKMSRRNDPSYNVDFSTAKEELEREE